MDLLRQRSVLRSKATFEAAMNCQSLASQSGWVRCVTENRAEGCFSYAISDCVKCPISAALFRGDGCRNEQAAVDASDRDSPRNSSIACGGKRVSRRAKQ